MDDNILWFFPPNFLPSPRQLSKKAYMIIIEIKDGESIDRALKRYKRKHRDVGVVKELRRRQQFTKPSVRRRDEILKARYLLEKEIESRED